MMEPPASPSHSPRTDLVKALILCVFCVFVSMGINRWVSASLLPSYFDLLLYLPVPVAYGAALKWRLLEPPKRRFWRDTNTALLGMAVSFIVVGFRLVLMLRPEARAVFLNGAPPLHARSFPYYFIVALSEELLFRGVVFAVAARALEPYRALVLSSLAFAIAHILFRLPVSWGDAVLMLFTYGVDGGLVFGAAYWYTRRVWLSVGLHWGNDLAGVVLLGDSSLGIARFALPTGGEGGLAIRAFGALILPILYTVPLMVLAARRDRREKQGVAPVE